MDVRRASPRRVRTGLVTAAALLGAACSQTPTRTATVVPPAPPPPQLYVYPAAGQDPTRLNRDRYDCHLWAVRQSHFDPSLSDTQPAQQVRVVSAGPPPGSGIVTGAVTGAVLGAAVSNPWNAEEGALIGAATGAVVGAIAEGAATSEAQRVEQLARNEPAVALATQQQRSVGYRRAMTACLVARGYSVR